MKLQFFNQIHSDNPTTYRNITITVTEDTFILELGGLGYPWYQELTDDLAQDYQYIEYLCENETVRVYNHVRNMLAQVVSQRVELRQILANLETVS